MKKYLLFLLIVSSQICYAYKITTINTHWKFSLENRSWHSINLPHTWNNIDAYSDSTYYRGTAFYSKIITMDQELINKECWIQFDGVNAFTDLYINSQFVGSHKGGYTAFRFNISKFLKPGKNEIKVKVNNELDEDYPPLAGDFTIFGGIYRDVSLIIVNKVHIDMNNLSSSGIFLRTPKVNNSTAKVNLSTKLTNNLSKQEEVILEVKIRNHENTLVSEIKKKYLLGGHSSKNIDLNLPEINKPQLWSPNAPNLYLVEINIFNTQKELLDHRLEPLGLRWFRIDPKHGFFLNGKPLKLIGVNRHQDFKGFGNALPDAMHLKDMKLIKQMGCNFLRIAHYPQDQIILQECDRLGILACVEIPMNNRNNVDSKIYWQNAILRQREMVRQNFNHPSVIIWAMMNECLLFYSRKIDSTDPYLKKTGELANTINKTLKEEDPDRLTMIVNSQRPERHLAAGTGISPDIIGWNLYHAWYGPEIFDDRLNNFIAEMHQKFPDKGLMITEFGAGADPRLHSFSPKRWDFSCEYQVKVHKYFMETILTRNDVIGGAVWNFADFASDSRQDTDPKMNSKGLVSYDRIPKNAYYYFETMLSDKPIVRIASKNWKNRSGLADEYNPRTTTQQLQVFSNSDSVRLYINNELVGKEKTDKHHSAYFKVPFTNGRNKLEAISDKASDFAFIYFQLIPYSLQNTYVNFNVSLGSERYFTSRITGENFIPEKPYTKGSWGYVGGKAVIQKGLPAVGTSLNIYKTDDDPVYQSHREEIKEFNFDTSNGKYEITLLFTEPVSAKKKKTLIYELDKGKPTTTHSTDRIFDVEINEVKYLNNFDIFNEFGARTAVSKKIEIDVKDEKGIHIKFIPVKGKTLLSGIKIRTII